MINMSNARKRKVNWKFSGGKKLYKKFMVQIQSKLLELSSLRGPRAVPDWWSRKYP